MLDKNKKYILDGGSGQTLIEKGLIPKGSLWSATALIDKKLHYMILDMHLDFINAGSDIIVTSNFSVRKNRLIEHNKLDSFEYATKQAGKLAKQAKLNSNKDVLIAGSLPTQGTVYFAEINLTEIEIFNNFKQAASILNPYVDLFYLDVLCSFKEISIALEAIKEFDKTSLIGIHLNNNGKLPSNEEIEDICDKIENYNCSGIILACVSPEIVNLSLKKMSNSKLPFGFKVNAFKNIPEDNQDYLKIFSYKGNPVEVFGTREKEFTPEFFENFVASTVKKGAKLLGGCCEIKPKHINSISKLF